MGGDGHAVGLWVVGAVEGGDEGCGGRVGGEAGREDAGGSWEVARGGETVLQRGCKTRGGCKNRVRQRRVKEVFQEGTTEARPRDVFWRWLAEARARIRVGDGATVEKTRQRAGAADWAEGSRTCLFSDPSP